MSWRQGQAYSQDLRDRVFSAVDAGVAAREVATVFEVSVSYIYKALIRRRLTGETGPRPQTSHTPRALAHCDGAIAAHVAAHDDLTLAELRAWLFAEHGVTVSVATVWETLRRLGLTLKKSRCAPPSRTARTLRERATPGGRCNRA